MGINVVVAPPLDVGLPVIYNNAVNVDIVIPAGIAAFIRQIQFDKAAADVINVAVLDNLLAVKYYAEGQLPGAAVVTRNSVGLDLLVPAGWRIRINVGVASFLTAVVEYYNENDVWNKDVSIINVPLTIVNGGPPLDVNLIAPIPLPVIGGGGGGITEPQLTELEQTTIASLSSAMDPVVMKAKLIQIGVLPARAAAITGVP